MNLILFLLACTALVATNNVPRVDGFPFKICPNSPPDFSVQNLNVFPDPPVKGSNIVMELEGYVDEQLTSGSNFIVDVLYLGVEIFSETINMDTATILPAGPGNLTLNYSVLIPKIAPSGSYVIPLTFNDQTGTEIGCISVAFQL